MFKIGDVVVSKTRSIFENALYHYIVEDVQKCTNCNEQNFLATGESRNEVEVQCTCGQRRMVWGGSRDSKYFKVVDVFMEGKDNYLEILNNL